MIADRVLNPFLFSDFIHSLSSNGIKQKKSLKVLHDMSNKVRKIELGKFSMRRVGVKTAVLSIFVGNPSEIGRETTCSGKRRCGCGK